MRKLPDKAQRRLVGLALAAALLSAIGLLTTPVVSPLMCKIYG